MDKHWSVVCFLTLTFFMFVTLHSGLAKKEKNNVKPGVCPSGPWGVGRCAEFCSSDSDCQGDLKCCSNGCGHACTKPYIVRRGQCPKPLPTQICAEYCYHDGQCPGEQRCCRTSCGHACTDIQPC